MSSVAITVLISGFYPLVKARPVKRPEQISSLRPSRSPCLPQSSPPYTIPNQNFANIQRSLAPNLTRENHHPFPVPQGGRSGGAWSSQTQRESKQLQLRRPGEQREREEVNLPVPRGKEREGGKRRSGAQRWDLTSHWTVKTVTKFHFLPF
jgi:hypothetical protein